MPQIPTDLYTLRGLNLTPCRTLAPVLNVRCTKPFAHRSRQHEALGHNDNDEPFVIPWPSTDEHIDDIDDDEHEHEDIDINIDDIDDEHEHDDVIVDLISAED
jgi:hypothetical protein